MEKKRSKCETSTRTTIILNTLNPKEKVISDFLLNQYNKSDTIKDILYQYITNNLHDDKSMVSHYVVTDKLMISNDTTNDNDVISNNIVNDKEIINNDFSINLDEIKDEEIEVEHNQEDETKQADNNALEFIKNGF